MPEPTIDEVLFECVTRIFHCNLHPEKCSLDFQRRQYDIPMLNSPLPLDTAFLNDSNQPELALFLLDNEQRENEQRSL
jgi:hypothetical protein